VITKELLNLSLMANEGKDASSPHQRYEQFISSLPLRQGSLRSRWYRGCLYPEIHLPGLLGSVHVCEPHTHTIREPITCWHVY